MIATLIDARGALRPDWQAFVRDHWAGLDATQREEAMQAVAATPGLASSTQAAIREMLRERLPGCLQRGATRPCVHVDSLHALGTCSFWIRGWIYPGPGTVARLRIISPEGAAVELLPGLPRHARTDLALLFTISPTDGRLAEAGFAGMFELNTPSSLDDGWVIELHASDGTAVEAMVTPVRRHGQEAAVLGTLALPNSTQWLEPHVGPAVARLQETRAATLQAANNIECGRRPVAPLVSVVVLLGDDPGLMQHQLAQFSRDPEMFKVDLVYVATSTNNADALAATAAQLGQLYPVPFRTVILNQDVSRSEACNFAARVARGRFLVLLDAAVLPEQPGWLGALVRAHEASPRSGVFGARLLREDGTENGQSTRPSDACLLVTCERFLSLGGLGCKYLTMEYGIADLCRRLTDAGLENRRLSVTLYHLDKLAGSETITPHARDYDDWLLHHSWGKALNS
jgi:hypothetical protein